MNQTTRIATPPPNEAGLAALEAQVARDLEALNLPPKNWVPPMLREGVPVLDVVVIGAGMNGIAAAGSLIFKGMPNIAVLEAASPGHEGPWCTTARMDTLRSPKTLPGPCFGIPSLTFRAWYVASFGEKSWEELYKIFNRTWQEYLTWLQRVLKLPVTHFSRVTRIEPADGLLRLTVEHPDGTRHVLARRLVMATGRAGAGGLDLPGFVDHALFPDLAALAPQPIDFEALRGKSIGIIGGGASAFDNAATALERGAARADLYVRRAVLPQVNKGRGSTGPHFHNALDALPPDVKWKLHVYLYDQQAPVPHETVHRALRQPGFHIHLSTPTKSARREGDAVVVSVGGAEPREVRHDYLIVATGFSVNPMQVPELGDLAPHVQRWIDVIGDVPPELRRAEIETFPVLGPGFELQPRDGSAPPELSRIHLVNYGAHLSHGGIASDIPGVVVAGERVADAILRSLFLEEFPAIRQALVEYDEPELIGTPFYVPKNQESPSDT
ncbi:FAD-dependent oxidoreductase [Roseococcus sp. YIM B11640]|uniref:FAD-dependent oxidoreductase n=1 Tax=Roseococcus sp. YIM B11640 TaxID=3133973 RepID=UPI003C79C698